MNNRFGLVAVIMTILVGVILIGTLLAPTIEGIQKTAGNVVTLENETGEYVYTKWSNQDLEINYDSSASLPDAFTIDGETTGLVFTATPTIVIASNDFTIRTGTNNQTGNILTINYLGETVAHSGQNRAFNIKITDGSYELTMSGASSPTLTGTMEWMVFASTEGDMGITQVPRSTPFYMDKDSELVVIGGVYTTGNNDTYYSYYDGLITVNDAYREITTVTVNKTLADGYTDIYKAEVVVTIGDETFNPWYILAPIEATGHETNGAAYTLYGVVIVLFIVVLFVVAVRSLISRERD